MPSLPETFDQARERDQSLASVAPKDWQPKLWCSPCIKGESFGQPYPSWRLFKKGHIMCLVCTKPLSYLPEDCCGVHGGGYPAPKGLGL